MVRIVPYPAKAHCASGTAVSLVCAQVKNVPTARALSLSGGCAARALSTCARPAALVGVGPYPAIAHYASGTAVSIGARPCFDLPAAASKREAYLRTCASQKCANRAHSLSLRRKRSTRACDVRARCRAGWSRPISHGSPLRQRDGRLPRCTAVLRRASRGLQTRSLLAYVRKSNSANRARSLSLRRKRSTRACDVHGRCRAD